MNAGDFGLRESASDWMSIIRVSDKETYDVELLVLMALEQARLSGLFRAGWRTGWRTVLLGSAQPPTVSDLFSTLYVEGLAVCAYWGASGMGAYRILEDEVLDNRCGWTGVSVLRS